MKQKFDYQFDLLMKEIDTLQSNIRNYDGILFKIKGWAITLFSGFVFFAFREKEPVFVLFGIFGVILFWTLDALNKKFQRVFISRYNKIEHFLRSDAFTRSLENGEIKTFNLPDIGGRVSVKNLKSKTSALKASLYWHTSSLYLAMILMGLGLFVYQSYGS